MNGREDGAIFMSEPDHHGPGLVTSVLGLSSHCKNVVHLAEFIVDVKLKVTVRH